MSYMKVVGSFFTAYHVLNVLACFSYIVMKTVHPICDWVFSGEERCELSWADSETLVFVGIVLAFKNTKWRKGKYVNIDFFSMVVTFFKAVNLVLFLRADWRLFIIYVVICIVLFIAFPEPIYSGPDDIKHFNGTALEDELKQNPEVTLLMEFYTMWSPPCKRLAEPFAEISLEYDTKYLKFGKMDLGRNPVTGQRFNVDDSVTSRQLPTLILFKNGKEFMRRPVRGAGRDGTVVPFLFTKENIVQAFDLKSCYEFAKEKLQREEKRSRKDEKKKL